MNKLLTVLLPALTLTMLSACDAEYGDTDERMFETDIDDGEDDEDDLDVLPNDIDEEPGWDLEKNALGDEGLDLEAPDAPTPDLDVLDAPNGDPILPQLDDGDDGEPEPSPLPEKEFDDGENAQAGYPGDDGLEASDEYDEGPIPGNPTPDDIDDEEASCEGPGGESYEVGEQWMEDCNVCHCTDQGAVCTSKACELDVD
jgi:hypothetical protein